MRLPREFVASGAWITLLTVGYLALARGGPLDSSGWARHTLGAAGLLAMLGGTFGYAWRKRRNGPGALQSWLRAHIITGIVGPYLVLLHSAFAFRGVAGVAFGLMLVVVASGIVGRYVYTTFAKQPHYLTPASVGRRRVAAAWWLLHVPLAIALFVLAVVHVLGALYYATLLH